jgi:hypothetical protein
MSSITVKYLDNYCSQFYNPLYKWMQLETPSTTEAIFLYYALVNDFVDFRT